MHLDWSFALAFGLIVSLLTGMADAMWLARREAPSNTTGGFDRFDGRSVARRGQRADSAGNRRGEGRAPLRPQLEEMLGRLRLGDEPPAVFAGLAVRVPLDNFRLFSSALPCIGKSVAASRRRWPRSAGRFATGLKSAAAFAR